MPKARNNQTSPSFLKEIFGFLSYIIPPTVGGHPCRPERCFLKSKIKLQLHFKVAIFVKTNKELHFKVNRYEE